MLNHKNVAKLGVAALIGVISVGAAVGFDHRVKVESNDGHRARHTENIGRDETVRLVRQLSDARCVEGRTWGWDNRGIWVDRGCRAEFLITDSGHRNPGRDRDDRGRGNGNSRGNGRGNLYSTRIELSSNNGKQGV